jgi:hypothetical protein
MRPVAICCLLLLALAGLAITPSAAAAPPQPACNGVWALRETVGPVTVFASPPCYRVTIAQIVDCGDPLDGPRTVTVGQASVVLPCGQVDPCEPPMDCYPTSAAVAIPPVCIEREVASGPVRAGFDQCRQDHETFPCHSVQRIHEYEQVGPVWAQVHVCLPHSPPPAAAETNPCGGASLPTTVTLEVPQVQSCPAPVPLCSGVSDPVAGASGPVGANVDVQSNCRVDLYVKADVMDCLWGEGYSKAATAGPVNVWTWGCKEFDPTATAAAMADPFPTCIRECSPLPSEACGLRDGTPSPLVHPLWGYDCTLDVHTACTGGASGSTDARIGFVDVSIAQCGGGPAWG